MEGWGEEIPGTSTAREAVRWGVCGWCSRAMEFSMAWPRASKRTSLWAYPGGWAHGGAPGRTVVCRLRKQVWIAAAAASTPKPGWSTCPKRG